MCSKIGIMAAGQIRVLGTRGQLKGNEYLYYELCIYVLNKHLSTSIHAKDVDSLGATNGSNGRSGNKGESSSRKLGELINEMTAYLRAQYPSATLHTTPTPTTYTDIDADINTDSNINMPIQTIRQRAPHNSDLSDPMTTPNITHSHVTYEEVIPLTYHIPKSEINTLSSFFTYMEADFFGLFPEDIVIRRYTLNQPTLEQVRIHVYDMIFYIYIVDYYRCLSYN